VKDHVPNIAVIGGPNGAGKTSIAREVLDATLGVTEFVNADVIASGLSGFDPERAAFAAGRIMLSRLRELAASVPPTNFAFESTLASRTFARWLSGLIDRGFAVHVIYVWLRSPELAIRRVRARIRRGGHSLPEDVIRRRYVRSATNFFRLYRPLAQRAGAWQVFDNSSQTPELIAHGGRGSAPTILHEQTFRAFQAVGENGGDGSTDDFTGVNL